MSSKRKTQQPDLSAFSFIKKLAKNRQSPQYHHCSPARWQYKLTLAILFLPQQAPWVVIKLAPQKPQVMIMQVLALGWLKELKMTCLKRWLLDRWAMVQLERQNPLAVCERWKHWMNCSTCSLKRLSGEKTLGMHTLRKKIYKHKDSLQQVIDSTAWVTGRQANEDDSKPLWMIYGKMTDICICLMLLKHVRCRLYMLFGLDEVVLSTHV